MVDIFKEILPSILETKIPVLNEDNEKDYVPYIINKALSHHIDCIMYVNEMNMHPEIGKLPQYFYYINTIRGYKRPYKKWMKKDLVENLEIVGEYYNVSNEKAEEILNLLSDDQILVLKERLFKGGISNENRNRRPNRGKTK